MLATRSFFAAALIILLVSNVAPAADFFGLGDLDGGFLWSQAYGISADGSTVAGASHTGVKEAFRYTEVSGMVGLESIGQPDWTAATGASSDGSILSGFGRSVTGVLAFTWDGTEITELADLEGGLLYCAANDISSDASTVVGFGMDATGIQACSWDGASPTALGFGDLESSIYSEAFAVSGDGSVIAGFMSSATAQEAFRWTETGMMVGIGDLDGGTFTSQAFGISSDGTVIVGMSNSDNGDEAFSQTGVGAMVALGDLDGGDFSSRANAASADGSVIVGMATTGDGDTAFIWDANDQMQNLQTLLTTEYELDLTGWTLQTAVGISDDGLTITGTGVNPDGDTEAWLARLGTPQQSTPGDFDEDGDVDGVDFGLWQVGYPTPFGAATIDGDADGDGDVDGVDFGLWQGNYHPPVGMVVPEPATITLLIMGALACSKRRKYS